MNPRSSGRRSLSCRAKHARTDRTTLDQTDLFRQHTVHGSGLTATDGGSTCIYRPSDSSCKATTAKQGGPENPKAKRHRANHFFLHVGNSTVSSSLRRNLDVFPVAVDQSLHWSSCASVDRLIPSKHPLVDHFMHMANGAMPTSKATENDWCVSAI